MSGSHRPRRAATHRQLHAIARALNAEETVDLERAARCALCQHRAVERSLVLRPAVAPWLQRSSTPLCSKCELWLADDGRGLRPDDRIGVRFTADGSGSMPRKARRR